MTLNCRKDIHIYYENDVPTKGKEALTAQTMLKYLGYYTGNLDSEYGFYSNGATKLFQKDWNKTGKKPTLLVDGQIGPVTCPLLNQVYNQKRQQDKKKEATKKTTTKKPATKKKPAVKKKPVPQYISSNDANLTIDELHLKCDKVERLHTYPTGGYKTLQLIGGKHRVYPGSRNPTEYKITLHIHQEHWRKIRATFQMYARKKCRYYHTEIISGDYYFSYTRNVSKGSWFVLELTLIEAGV